MRARILCALTATTMLGLVASAPAHIERASYSPDPKPDTSVKPAAGGGVPTPRSLASALDASARGTTRVVCEPDSIKRLRSSIAQAVKQGYDIRPHDHRSFSKAQGKALLKTNQKFFALCKYREI